MKAVVATFNQEKALVGAFSVITNLRVDLFEALISTDYSTLNTVGTVSLGVDRPKWLSMRTNMTMVMMTE